MPWMSIIMWILSFVLAKSKGASTAEAALLATGVAAATYYVADPSNEDNLLGLGKEAGSVGSAKNDPGSVTEQSTAAPTGTDKADSSTAGSTVSTVGSVLSTGIKTAGSTLSSWGAAGTAGVIATTAAVGGLSNDSSKWLLWGGVALVALLILRQKEA